VIAHAEEIKDSVNLWSIDTGNNGNILAGNYFTMNKDHLEGKLRKMFIGSELE
jgi:hypothetical protein